jgi:hypothetical protein
MQNSTKKRESQKNISFISFGAPVLQIQEGVGTEWLKAFFQCKESIVSGTEFDPRIWY